MILERLRQQRSLIFRNSIFPNFKIFDGGPARPDQFWPSRNELAVRDAAHKKRAVANRKRNGAAAAVALVSGYGLVFRFAAKDCAKESFHGLEFFATFARQNAAKSEKEKNWLNFWNSTFLGGRLKVLKLFHTTLWICCNLRHLVAFLQRDRKFSISVVLQSSATVAVSGA